MRPPATHLIDNTLRLAIEGYGWLPNLRRRRGEDVLHTRLAGQRAVGLCGPDAARFFYDERHIRRRDAIPEPILATLFGHGAVHTLDGAEHRRRKVMFLALMTPDGIADLVAHATAAWDEAVASWAAQPRVVLFEEASRVLTTAVHRWVGIPPDGVEIGPLAADLVAMVDGFAAAGPRHLRARRARQRRERWLAHLIEQVRRGALPVDTGSAVDVIAHHREPDGDLLDARVAAVELLNVLRPTVAVSWFFAFAAHALHRWPRVRTQLRAADPAYTEAFTHELRRFYPFAPFIGGRAATDLTYRGEPIRAGSIVLLDVYGQHHDPHLWPDPYAFTPGRFLNRQPAAFELLPQGGGDPRAGHRCPGEPTTVALLTALTPRLAALDYEVPDQDLDISLRRIPARPASGFVISAVRPPAGGTPPLRGPRVNPPPVGQPYPVKPQV